MPNFIDLIGQRFGKLVVVGRTNKGKKSKSVRWECMCDCGNTSFPTTAHLRNSGITSCGCMLGNPLPNGQAALNWYYSEYKSSAKKRGIEFCLSKEEFKKLTSANCFYCGQEPNRTRRTSKNTGEYIHNGIDRVDNSKGYILGNCVSCCKECNIMKMDLSIAEFLHRIKIISERFGQ
jgi:hypothetical protein